MPERNDALSRGNFLKLCFVGAVGLVATACGAGEDDEDDEENGEDEEDDDDDEGGLY
jgi:hypothetical protein